MRVRSARPGVGVALEKWALPATIPFIGAKFEMLDCMGTPHRGARDVGRFELGLDARLSWCL
jgi:hypothetical protein